MAGNKSITDDLLRYEIVKWLLNRAARYTRKIKKTWKYLAALALPIAAGVYLHYVLPDYIWLTNLITAFFVIGVAGWGEHVGPPVSKISPKKFDKGVEKRLDGLAERAYVSLVLFTAGCSIAIVQASLLPRSFLITYFLLSLTLSVIRVTNKRYTVTGSANRYVDRWILVAEIIDEFKGSHLIDVTTPRGVPRLVVRLRPGQDPHNVYGTRRRLESVLSLRPGSVSIVESADLATDVEIYIKDNPISEPIPHPLIDSRLPVEWPVLMGVGPNNQTYLHEPKHTLVVGQSGSGKSEFGESILAYVHADPEMCIFGSDMASGATLSLWEPVLAAPLAKTLDESLALLDGVLRVCEAREQAVGARKVEDPKAPAVYDMGPAIWFIIDEFPELVRQGGAKFNKQYEGLAKRARKARLILLALSQNGSMRDLGVTETRSQFHATIAMKQDVHGSRTLLKELHTQGWATNTLKTGEFRAVIEDPTPNRFQSVFLMDTENKTEIINRYKTTYLEKLSYEAFKGA